MKKISIVLTALVALVATACPEAPPPPSPPPVEVKEPPPPPPPPPPVVETLKAYEPTGEFADLKKGAAAGIDDKNAVLKAAETEAALDVAIAALEAKHKKK